jgi:hypothetical protein
MRSLVRCGVALSSLGALCIPACSSSTAPNVIATSGMAASSGSTGANGSGNAGGTGVSGTANPASGSVASTGVTISSGAGATGSTSAGGVTGSTSGVGSGPGSTSGGDMDAEAQDAPSVDYAPTYDAQVVVDGGANGMVAPGLGVDTPSPPKPMVSGTARNLPFTASQADPLATKGQAGATQYGRIDPTTTLQWKLIVLLPGIGGGPGLGTSGWIASKGYHEFDVAYDDAIPGAPNAPDPRASDPATVGNTRMNQFDAKNRSPACADDACSANAPPIARPDCIEERVIKGLQYLAQKDPAGGWDWYLNPDGTMRWSDAGFFGYSYGATHAAVISVYVRLGLVVVGSGPWFEFQPEASFLRTTSATPGERAFAIYGKLDGRYPDYENNTRLMGWPGPYPFEIAVSTHGPLDGGAIPYYQGSHSILVDDQGHTEFCAQDYTECLYAFTGLGR